MEVIIFFGLFAKKLPHCKREVNYLTGAQAIILVNNYLEKNFTHS